MARSTLVPGSAPHGLLPGVFPGARCRPGGWARAARLLVAALAVAAWGAPLRAIPQGVADEDADVGDGPLDEDRRDPSGDTDAPADDERAAEEEGSVALPTDRLKERQLERVRRLLDDGRWSDSAALVDEILGSDRDFFFRPSAGGSTWQSIKTEAARLIGQVPAEGRQAYELQFRARADRALEQAAAARDDAAVVAVARRWFHTPAGRRATLLAALGALEQGRPLEAAAWLERLSAAPGREAFEPTLSAMRAIACWRAGERRAAVEILDRLRDTRPGALRLGGRDVSVTYPPGGAAAWLEGVAGPPDNGLGRSASEWWVHRGDAARNALVDASRPLLVPRYRVPLTRHPEEGRLLERRRKLFADRDMPLLPAGTPLAVDGLLLAHTPMGLLAVDFDTGKRVWLQTGGAAGSFFDAGDGDGDDADSESRGAIRGVFDDATSGTLSSNGRLVFAVESDPASLAGPTSGGIEGFRQFPAAPRGSNVLSAYDVSGKGALAWRLSGADSAAREVPPAQQFQPFAQPAAGAWFLGTPLPIGDQVFVLVEERGEIRLDVLSSADGSTRWSQPLAELDEGVTVGNRESHLRRVAGLSPSFAEGVLVCPTGAGTVVAVDLATRTLLWAYTYGQPRQNDSVLLPNGVRVQRGAIGGGVIVNGRFVAVGSGPSASSGWRDGSPTISGGRIILTPRESDEIHCVDLRSGAVVWKQARRDRLYVAGVVDGRVIVVGRRGVESLALADGSETWESATPLDGACPSGRGVLTAGRLFLPLDTPEVVEIDLADGSVAARSPARGGRVAGNLVAYRGEIVSQGVDSLDVFHQSAALGERIETAARTDPLDAWAGQWRGQLAIDAGAVAAGLSSLVAARASAPESVPMAVVRDALQAALERDFAAALPVLESQSGIDGGSDPAMLRLVVDGSLRSGDVTRAWRAFLPFLSAEVAGAKRAAESTTIDTGDRSVSLTSNAWIAGRFRRVLDVAPADLRAEIDRQCGEAVSAASAIRPVMQRGEALLSLEAAFGDHPAGARARDVLVPAIADMVTATGATTDAGRDLLLRRDLVVGAGPEPGAAAPSAQASPAVAWPFGRVVERRGGARGGADDPNRMARLVPIPLEGAEVCDIPGMRLVYDIQQPGFVVIDGLGRRLGEPVSLEPQARGEVMGGFQPFAAEGSVVGRVVVVRSGSMLVGFEVSTSPGQRHRRLWHHQHALGASGEMVMPFMARTIGERQNRLDTVALGTEVSEPDEVAPVASLQIGRVRASGLPVLVNTGLELRDPVSGRLRWERRRVAAAGEVIGDDDYVCVLPPAGRDATVVSTLDGRLVRTCDVPRRGARLLTCGRRIVVVDTGRAAAVRLSLLDPVTMESVEMGDFARDARATRVGDDALAVIEPSGTLAVVDLVTGQTRFRTKLPEMPAGIEQARVMPWEDRLVVFVGRRESPEERKLMEKVGVITSLPQQFSREIVQPATGSLWAVDRTDGRSLWSVPATILRHCIQPGQAEGLPVLLFSRQIQRPGGGDRVRMGILAIDKRTGQALCVDDKIGGQPQFLAGCEMVGDPVAHTVTIGRGGVEGGDVVLEFSGAPSAPRPPFQAASRQPVSRDVLSELEGWLEKVIQLPIPF